MTTFIRGARVAVAVFKQETATFSPVISRLDSFERAVGETLERVLGGTETEYAGAAAELRAAGAIVVPGAGAWANSGGPVLHEDLEAMIKQTIEGLERSLPLDGVILVLHGAMASTEEPDPEGRLLELARSLVGEIPIIASIDLHAVVTKRMLDNVDVLVPFHTYPHVDQFATGQRAASALRRLLESGCASSHILYRLPMLVRGDELLTGTGLLGSAISRCAELEREYDVLAAGVVIGNPFTDVPELASNVLVTTCGESSPFGELAREVAVFLWKSRHRLRAKLVPIDEALDLAVLHNGLTVLSDGADATTSGAPGDSNQILARIVDKRLAIRALAPIVDAPAVARARHVGAGRRGLFKLGGSLDLVRHTPIELEAVVVSLGDGRFRYEDGTRAEAGNTAVLGSDHGMVLVTERPVRFIGRQVFLEHGLDPTDFDVVVVKSPNGYRTYYDDPSFQLIAVDAPGCTTANLASLRYQFCSRPMWPLDETPDPAFISESL